ncbi:hypothetical protein [Lampropedia aestuarii]|uniref:hypothetical protein n=1 Tax=Lampropedia aestuarii TaxID=2562762 RepID=UPI001455FF25|nr:hypothetical protein [Lampropedia aestuarii]
MSSSSSYKFLRRSGALIRSPSLLMAIASCILLGILGVNEVAFRGANSALERGIQYQRENLLTNHLVQSLLQAEAQLKGYIASADVAAKEQYLRARASPEAAPRVGTNYQAQFAGVCVATHRSQR